MSRGERGTAKPYLRGDIWWIRFTVPGEGKERCESSRSTDKKVALRLLHDRMKAIDDRQIGPQGATVGDLLDLYLDDQRMQKRHQIAAAEGYVRLHLRPAFGHLAIARFESDHVADFIRRKQKEGYENSTINRWLEALRRGVTLGSERKPALVMVPIKLPRLIEDNVREGFLSPEDYRAMLEHLPAHLQLVLAIGYHWGMRRGEILALRWDQVDWAAGLVRLDRKQTKGKQARVAPLYGELRGWIERAFTERREGESTIVSYRGDHTRRPGENQGRPRKPGGVMASSEEWGVTPKTARRILALDLEGAELAAAIGSARANSRNRQGKNLRPRESREAAQSAPRPGAAIKAVKTAWARASEAAGLQGLLVHDLRRTAVRNMVRAGIPEKNAMRISGHKTRAIFDRYDIVDERDIHEAGRKMGLYQAALEDGKDKVRTEVRTVSERAEMTKAAKGVSIQ